MSTGVYKLVFDVSCYLLAVCRPVNTSVQSALYYHAAFILNLLFQHFRAYACISVEALARCRDPF